MYITKSELKDMQPTMLRSDMLATWAFSINLVGYYITLH